MSLSEGVSESMSVLECMLSVSPALGDNARVVLIGKEEEENDYINASYIDVSRFCPPVQSHCSHNPLLLPAELLQPEGLPDHPGSSGGDHQ